MDPIERAGREEIAALQEKLLRLQLNHAWENVPFYRDRWTNARIDPAKIHTLSDLRNLPIVTKADFDSDLLLHPPFGTYQGNALPARIHASSGITGEPRPVFCTANDCLRIAQLSARRLRAQGVQPADRVQVTLPYALYIGGAIAIEGAMVLGAAVIPTGTGAMTQSRRQIEIARHWQPTVLCATPSYALRLADVAKEINLDPARDFQFRIIYVTAEVVTPELRVEIERRWNATVFDNYGSVEAAASTYECEHRTGWHISEDAYIFEVLDPATGDPCPPGADGVLVVTSLFREASPFIRYRVGDIVSISDDPCPCGRTFRRMSKVKGRADEMLKLRGVSVYPTAMEVVLRSFPELGMEWQLVLNNRDSAQEIVVKVEAACSLQDEERSALTARVQERLHAQTGIRPAVELFDPGCLIAGQLGREAAEGREGRAAENRIKTRRVIDLRNSPETP
jgi:phenylacetate-CoA ligase